MRYRYNAYVRERIDKVGGREGGVLFNAMHGRSYITMDHRISTMPGRSTLDFHRRRRHCSHQTRRDVRCWTIGMEGELRPIHAKHRLWCECSYIWITAADAASSGSLVPALQSSASLNPPSISRTGRSNTLPWQQRASWNPTRRQNHAAAQQRFPPSPPPSFSECCVYPQPPLLLQRISSTSYPPSRFSSSLGMKVQIFSSWRARTLWRA